MYGCSVRFLTPFFYHYHHFILGVFAISVPQFLQLLLLLCRLFFVCLNWKLNWIMEKGDSKSSVCVSVWSVWFKQFLYLYKIGIKKSLYSFVKWKKKSIQTYRPYIGRPNIILERFRLIECCCTSLINLLRIHRKKCFCTSFENWLLTKSFI